MSKITDLIEKVNKEAIRAEGCNNGVVEILTELLPQIQSIQSEQQEMISYINEIGKEIKQMKNAKNNLIAMVCFVRLEDQYLRLLEKITGKKEGE